MQEKAGTFSGEVSDGRLELEPWANYGREMDEWSSEILSILGLGWENGAQPLLQNTHPVLGGGWLESTLKRCTPPPPHQITFEDGDKYEGYFLSGVFHGQGQHVFPDGAHPWLIKPEISSEKLRISELYLTDSSPI